MQDIKWSVVVATAPREHPKLQITIDCLNKAGWNDPVVFSEPDSYVSTAKTIHNDPKKGVWHNWLQSVNFALDSGADAIMTVQDDITVHPESKMFAEKVLNNWPKDAGYLSLYTPHHYSIIKGNKKPWGVYPIHTRSIWGAMCLVWKPETLREIVSSNRAKTWIGVRKQIGDEEYENRVRNPELVRNLDTVLGYAIHRDLSKKTYYCNPSCCQHISEDSSIGGRPATGKRAARFVAGEDGNPTPSEIPVPEQKETKPKTTSL